MTNQLTSMNRRTFLTRTGGVAVAGLAFGVPSAIGKPHRLTLTEAEAQLTGPNNPKTRDWAFNGRVPGPELRFRQGDRLAVEVENRLPQETTVHWHGIRLPNAMDGVPHLTQKPIGPNEAFSYVFDLPDAGTYWYHPHMMSAEQVGRGLYGPLIVEERERIQVDRDVTWVLDDWRLDDNAQIDDGFGNMMDASHAGRIGNTITINGRAPEPFPVRRGERIRLRLINAANARIFGLEFAGHKPTVIAYDGQPVEPHAPGSGRVVLGPAMRIDLVVDMMGKPGEHFTITDSFYRRSTYPLVEISYGTEPLRERPLDAAVALPANTMPEPDLPNALRHDVLFQGGMMSMMIEREMGGSSDMSGGMGSMMEMMQSGRVWRIDGIASVGHVMKPMLTLERGRTAILAMTNMTAWPHPMHLHGHSFRVISRGGQPTRFREWQDTVLILPRERVEIAFVADNLGDRMFHSHILEHQAAGMMGVIRIA
jgi:FtsP/CotA-like multicopper oxidase with cupredoxin domain